MVSVVMITKNEEMAVSSVVQDIKKYAPEAEIIIVDSSADRTPEIAESMGARVIRQFPPQGYGRAMDRALRAASGDAIITLDCDNTYPAEMIPILARAILEEGYDLVDGSRLGRKPKAMPWLNYLANRGFAMLASILFFRKITDLHSGMRAYKRSLVRNLNYDPGGPALPVELLLKPLRLGYKIKFIFIEYRDRLGTSTMQPLGSAWWTLRRILAARFRGCR
jgi:glycosyltransferase involved in cell wall biosynthesis